MAIGTKISFQDIDSIKIGGRSVSEIWQYRSFYSTRAWKRPLDVQGIRFTSIGGNTISLIHSYSGSGTDYIPSLQYSPSGTKNSWYTWSWRNGESIVLRPGESIFIKGNNPSGFNNSSSQTTFAIAGEGYVFCYGNVTELLGAGWTADLPSNYCFYKLFGNCRHLRQAPNLPSKNLTAGCYESMFMNSGLFITPDLPSTNLATGCYQTMFSGCEDLGFTIQKLPAMDLKNYCYSGMFKGCTSLREAPILPATDISSGRCYELMFLGCSKLTYVQCLAERKGILNYPTDSWLDGVATLGLFEASSAAGWWERNRDGSGVPEKWTIRYVN